MSDKWYYVQEGERVGPVEFSEIINHVKNSALGNDDFVWCKGMSEWTRIEEVQEIQKELVSSKPPKVEIPSEDSLGDLAGNTKSVFIKIGADRGADEVEYGPYSLNVIKKLFEENRINAKTFVFVKGMTNWKLLADFKDFSELFNDAPPPIQDSDRRSSIRKPFVARMYIQNQNDVFIGICRDVSVGGMQVLVDDFPGKIGDNIAINVHPENTEYHFVASGSIVRLLDGHQGFSFRFSNLSEDSKNAIEKYLENEQ